VSYPIDFDKLNRLAELPKVQPIVTHVRQLVEQKEEIVWSMEYQVFLQVLDDMSIRLGIDTDEILMLWIAGEYVYGELSILDEQRVRTWFNEINSNQACFYSAPETFSMRQLNEIMIGIRRSMRAMSQTDTHLTRYHYKHLQMLHRKASKTREVIRNWG